MGMQFPWHLFDMGRLFWNNLPKLFLTKHHMNIKLIKSRPSLVQIPFKENKRNTMTNISISEYSNAIDEFRGVIRPKEDIKDIIRYFDEEVKYLHKKLEKTKEELRTNILTINNELIDVKSDLGKKVQETKQLVSDSNVSNIWLDLFGISIIFVGLIYGTIPDIIEKFIQ